MKPAATTALAVALQTGTPTLLIGPPGGGKTSTIYALGQTLGVPVHTLIGSILDPTDLSGMPYRTEGGVRFAPPAWALSLAHAPARAGLSSLLFLDELSSAPPPIQAGLLRILFERVVGEQALPPSCGIVAAMNPPDQAASGVDLTPPLANRLFHLPYTVDAADWAQAMLSEFPAPSFPTLPGAWESHLPSTRALVAGFITANPALLSACPKDPAQAGEAWPSPRTWDYLARTLAGCRSISAPEDAEILLTAGLVGKGASVSFSAYCQHMDLPDPEETLSSGSKFKLPDRTDLHYVVLGAMVSTVLRDFSEARLKKGLTVLNAAADQGALAVAAACVRPLLGGMVKNVAKNLDLFKALCQDFPFLGRTLSVLGFDLPGGKTGAQT